MRFGSVCSGIEAASVAWASLGWKAAWFSEIEPFPCEVLKHHFPDVTNMGDMTLLPERIASGEVEPPDMLCGGTPCQAFSYAGKRRSLDDYRGNLSLTFCDIADSIDEVRTICGDEPCIIFWENVPGVLSTKDNAFGCFLGQLVGADAPLSSGSTRWPCAGAVAGPKRKAAWRVLDAQHFGVPQRRRRVFVVASARERVDPAEILFERKGVCGDSEKGGSRRQDAAAFTLGSFAQYREGVGTLKAQGGDIGGGSETLIVGTLTAQDAEKQFANNQAVDTGMLVVEPSVYDMTHACDVIRESDKAPTLQARMGTGGNQIPLVLSENGSNRTVCVGITPPLKTTTPCYCLAENTIGREPKNGGNGLGVSEDLGFTLNATGVHGVMQCSHVRRLTPVECERLQGLPDNWTRIPYRGKTEAKCPDAPRYKAIGNSWAVPVVRWIGNRIKENLK